MTVFQGSLEAVVLGYSGQLAPPFVLFDCQAVIWSANIVSFIEGFLHDFVGLDFETLAHLLVLVFQLDELLVGLTALDSNGLFLLVSSFQVDQQRSLLVDFRRGPVVVVILAGAFALHHQVHEAILLLGVSWAALCVAPFLEEVHGTTLRLRNRLVVKLVLADCRLLHLRVRRGRPVVLKAAHSLAHRVESLDKGRFPVILVEIYEAVCIKSSIVLGFFLLPSLVLADALLKVYFR